LQECKGKLASKPQYIVLLKKKNKKQNNPKHYEENTVHCEPEETAGFIKCLSQWQNNYTSSQVMLCYPSP